MKMIVAHDLYRGIALKGQIPWHCPPDLQYFKKTTMGGSVLMGRKTFETLKKPLPGRKNIVASATANFDNVQMVRDLDKYLLEYDHDDLWIIGGEQIYNRVIGHPLLTEIHCTKIYSPSPMCDQFFPEIPPLFEQIKAKEMDTFAKLFVWRCINKWS